MTKPHEGRLIDAQTRADEAAAEVDRLQVTAKLCEQDGLAYASLSGEQLGPMLVTYRHAPVGELHTTSPSALKDWYARPYQEDGSLGADLGPYVNARAAAAALIPGRTQPEPSARNAG